ncbi:Hsp20/alpha crystallin family protein [Alkalihalobacterium elongatum]|uniref:Hsp20/alpha crystallin family protein n=1 Tax=Alkalihalobacterium elongatum TaxID=2675466 RepID=UPI001C1F75B9|nr:Hsp20/alpha crystallin family protein [Alkalihalobacterium elongatum]
MNKQGTTTNWNRSVQDLLGEDFSIEFPGLMKNQTEVPVNMYESGKELICVFSLPGLHVEDVDIYVEQNIIELRGTLQVTDHDFRLVQEGILQGPIKRTIELPYPVKDDDVQYSYNSGLLTVYLQRMPRFKQKKHQHK